MFYFAGFYVNDTHFMGKNFSFVAVDYDPLEQSNPSPYVCENCGKSYKQNKNLKRHIKIECNKPPRFKCFYCSYRSKRKAHMKSHFFHRHSNLPIKYEIDPNAIT